MDSISDTAAVPLFEIAIRVASGLRLPHEYFHTLAQGHEEELTAHISYSAGLMMPLHYVVPQDLTLFSPKPLFSCPKRGLLFSVRGR